MEITEEILKDSELSFDDIKYNLERIEKDTKSLYSISDGKEKSKLLSKIDKHFKNIVWMMDDLKSNYEKLKGGLNV